MARFTMFILSTFCSLLLTGTHLAAGLEIVGDNKAANTAGGQRFDSVLGITGALQMVQDATSFVQSVLNNRVKDVTKITFLVEDMDGVAYTVGGSSATESEIHLSARYVGTYSGDVVQEIKGVLYHETTHVWQFNGQDTAPSGVIEGVADYVRLKANLAPSHWVQPGGGDRWDQGYDVTARFFDYCNSLLDGFVWQLNARLQSSTWNESIFVELLGKSVQDLWSDYKAKYSG